MYIACPECNTKFVVTPEQIGTHGRKVKCSKCAHAWYQKLDDHLQIEPLITAPITQSVITPFGNGINLPALLPIRTLPYIFIIPIMLIGLILFMLVMLLPNKIELNSLLNDNNLSIKDIKIENKSDIEKIAVSYKIYNSSANNIKTPLVRIRLFDKNNKFLKSVIDDHANVDILPNHFLQVRTELVPVPPSANNIDIMPGNKIDFILR